MYQNKFNLALPLAVWLASDEYSYAKYPNELSTTTLLRSPRYIIGTRREMFPEQWEEHLRPIFVEPNEFMQTPDVQERIASRMGTAIHSSVEFAWKHHYKQALTLLGYDENQIDKILIDPEPEDVKEDSVCVYLESRQYREIDGFVISGQFDVVLDGHLHDIKTTSTFSYTSGCNDEKYVLQGSIYRWLNPELITGDTLTINFLFTDWNRFTANQQQEGYPPAKAFSKKYKLMSLKETEMYIKNKIKTLQKYWNYPIEQIPCCTEKELFSKPPVFKYYKGGYAEGKRATRNFDTYIEASNYRAKQGSVGDIIEHKSDPFMCAYCNPAEVEQMMSKTHTRKIGII